MASASAAAWIQSLPFDVTFLLGPPLVGIMAGWLLALGPNWTGVVVLGLLGVPHYLSTFAFYFWPENHSYHRAHWHAYAFGPLLLAAGLLASFRLDRPPLYVPTLLFFWNTIHVARQSCGVLSVYRHRAGVIDLHQRNVANAAILSTSLWLSLWNVDTHQQARAFLSSVTFGRPGLLWTICGVLSLLCLARLAASLWRRSRNGTPPGAPELACLVSGLVLFHPFLWLSDSAQATLAMLAGHFVQYLGLLWLLHRRRFGSRQDAPRILARLSSHLPALAFVALAAGAGFVAGFVLFERWRLLGYFNAGFLVLVFLHFYLDGLFWAFKDPHVRATLSPYLTLQPAR